MHTSSPPSHLGQWLSSTTIHIPKNSRKVFFVSSAVKRILEFRKVGIYIVANVFNVNMSLSGPWSVRNLDILFPLPPLINIFLLICLKERSFSKYLGSNFFRYIHSEVGLQSGRQSKYQPQ
jgi:hypothetical protein